MALDHIVVQPAAGKSVLLTVPVGTPQCQVTIQNRSTTLDISIGDDTLGAVTGSNAGVKVAANGQIQLFLNGGDTIYAYAGTAFSTTSEYVVVLYSYIPTSTWS